MRRRMLLVGLFALAGCDGTNPEIETKAEAALSTRSFRLLHDDPPGGCETREYAGDGDWWFGACKTECNTAATGLSSSFAALPRCRDIVFQSPLLDPPPGPGVFEFTHKLACGGSAPGVNVASGYALRFVQSDDRRSPTVGFDWAPGLYKGECDAGSAITGVASDHYAHRGDACFFSSNDNDYAYGLVGARCSALTSPPGTYASFINCAVMNFTNNSAQETSSSGDWDFGFLKGECGDGRYIKGIAHGGFGNGAGRATRILCCTPAYLPIPS
jgi:hypothetical protein